MQKGPPPTGNELSSLWDRGRAKKCRFPRSYWISIQHPVCGFPRIRLLRLSEKGTSNSPSENLAAIRSAKWTEKPLLGDPLGSAGSVSETFRTVSEG